MRNNLARSACGCHRNARRYSPGRCPRGQDPDAAAVRRDPGQRDLQVALDIHTEGLQWGDVEDLVPEVRLASCPVPRINPARSTVTAPRERQRASYPEPVGATTRAWSPRLIASHACDWTTVGSMNTSRNQDATGAKKRSSGSVVSGVRFMLPSQPRAPDTNCHTGLHDGSGQARCRAFTPDVCPISRDLPVRWAELWSRRLD